MNNIENQKTAVSVAPRLLCPIFDRDGNAINVGDSFIYHPGTQFESTGEIFLRNGLEVVSWSCGRDILLLDFWYGPADSPITVKA